MTPLAKGLHAGTHNFELVSSRDVMHQRNIAAMLQLRNVSELTGEQTKRQMYHQAHALDSMRTDPNNTSLQSPCCTQRA